MKSPQWKLFNGGLLYTDVTQSQVTSCTYSYANLTQQIQIYLHLLWVKAVLQHEQNES